MKKVVKNARKLYETRNDIINVFRGVESQELKKLEELNEKPNFNWLHVPEDDLEGLLKQIKDAGKIKTTLENDRE